MQTVFRTDRGTVSLYSGWISYPTVSLMRLPDKVGTLPSIAHSLQRVGYSTHYLYGGDIKIMGKKGYLVAAGYGSREFEQKGRHSTDVTVRIPGPGRKDDET